MFYLYEQVTGKAIELTYIGRFDEYDKIIKACWERIVYINDDDNLDWGFFNEKGILESPENQEDRTFLEQKKFILLLVFRPSCKVVVGIGSEAELVIRYVDETTLSFY